jgi:hypothetical protein
LYSGSWACCGCATCILGDFRELAVKSVGKPDARNGPVRFDERGRETTGCQSVPVQRPSSTLRFTPMAQVSVALCELSEGGENTIGVGLIAAAGMRKLPHSAAEDRWNHCAPLRTFQHSAHLQPSSRGLGQATGRRRLAAAVLAWFGAMSRVPMPVCFHGTACAARHSGPWSALRSHPCVAVPSAPVK